MIVRPTGILALALGLTGKIFAADPLLPDPNPPPALPGMKLLWSDEFNLDGRPDPKVWSYETGFVRNEELQWYQADNANCSGGVLVIEGRKQQVINPRYVAGSSDWKTNRQKSEYTSSSLTTSGHKAWQFGHVETRARLDGQMGTWPAIWTLGGNGEWPTNGEVDILEFYPTGGVPTLHANVAWGTATRWTAAWNSKTKPLSNFVTKDPDWIKKFHLWTMDWTADSIRLGLDGVAMNAVALKQTVNSDGTNPFKDRSQYLLLNLAIGSNGGDPSAARFPMKYEVDYVRVYQPAIALLESQGIASRPGAPRFQNVGTGQFMASSEAPGTLEIFDSRGQRILSKALGAEPVELDLRREPGGIYLARFRTGTNVVSSKLVR